MDIVTTQETITPEMATAYLSYNDRNRTLRPGTVDLYAAEMKANNWKMTGEPIVFDDTGRLLSGQHRLHACIKAEVAFVSLVVRNVTPDSRSVIDSGIKRTVADALMYDGVAQPNAKAAAAKLLLKWERDLIKITTVDIPRDEILNHVKQYDDQWRTAVILGDRIKKSIGMSPSTWAGLCFKFMSLDQERASDFIDKVISGAGLYEDDPVLTLRRWVNRTTQTKTRRLQWEQVAIAVKAWNAYVLGQKVSLLRVYSSESVPKPLKPVLRSF